MNIFFFVLIAVLFAGLAGLVLADSVDFAERARKRKETLSKNLHK